MAINTYFKNIADAIREKTGGSAFITPGQMPDEILNIPSGGVEWIEPLHTGVTSGYLNDSGIWIKNENANRNVSIYNVEDLTNEKLLIIKDAVSGTRYIFRTALFRNDPFYATGNISELSNFVYSSFQYEFSMLENESVSNIWKYLVVYTGDNSLTHKHYVCKKSDLLS